mmetsp:Transcript_41510/g.99763  ORF Transcript_41510/g.99763 Transcript_41510/m.99763 type:complete len:217 (+) Transcript_41510:1315-1965(+)
MGPGLVGRRALRHHVRAAVHLVPHLLPPRVGRRVARLPPRAQGPARQDQHGPARHPQPGVVPQPALHHAHRRHPALRRRLHRALLHHVLGLAAALLLRLRLPRARAAHPGGHVLRDRRGTLLLPAVQRGLRVVVALLPHGGLVGPLPLRLLDHVLLHAARHHRLRAHAHLLHLHVRLRHALLRHHGHHRLLLVLLVRVDHLRRDQGGLAPRRARIG